MGGQGETREARPGLYYVLAAPDGSKVYPKRKDGSDGAWRWGSDKVEREKKRIEWIKGKKGWNPYFRIYVDEARTRPPQTIWYNQEVGSNRTSKIELNNILDDTNLFNTPKPSALIKKIISISCSEDDIVLDSFAGSGTTAQAVLDLNAEDDGNRKFILIEQEDYADKITAERVRRVIKGVPKAKDEKLKSGLGGTFTYYTLGDALAEENLLRGGKMPSYMDLARYVFFTSTGEQLDDVQVDVKRFYLGESRNYQVYLLYKPDMEFLKHRPLDLEFVKGLGKPKGKNRLVIASHKYVDDFVLNDTRVEFCQLPFAIYRFRA